MMWGWEDGWSWGWGMGWMMIFGWLVPLLFLGLVVWLVTQAVGGGRGGNMYQPPAPPHLPPAPPHPRETPLEVAQRRYASGELSRDEFIRIRDDLGGGGAAPPA
jgi:putative membrane protein